MRRKPPRLGEISHRAGSFRLAGPIARAPRAYACAVLAAAVCSLLAPALAAGASAPGLAEVQADFSHELALAGAGSSAYVYDLSAKAALVSERALIARRPASVEKLYTATTALELMGPQARLSTSVLGVGRLLGEGTWEGSLYLRGGGDPTFGSS